MEVIELGSYTDEEKLDIAREHLLPKQLKENGIRRGQLRLDEMCIRDRYRTWLSSIRRWRRGGIPSHCWRIFSGTTGEGYCEVISHYIY